MWVWSRYSGVRYNGFQTNFNDIKFLISKLNKDSLLVNRPIKYFKKVSNDMNIKYLKK